MKIPDRVRLFSYTQEDEEGAAAAGGEMCWRENKTCLLYTAESVKEKLFLVCCCVLYISRSRLDSASGDVSRHQGQTTATPFFIQPILKIYYIYIYVRALLLQQCSVAIRYGPRESENCEKADFLSIIIGPSKSSANRPPIIRYNRVQHWKGSVHQRG